jgi:hypothetical protein
VSFRHLTVVAAIVAFALGIGYLFAGALVVGRWQIEPTSGVLLLGRRIGGLYLGLSVIFLLARSAPPSPARTAVSAGTAVGLLLLAILGVYEFTAGRAGRAILASAAVEGLLAAGFIRVLVADRRAAASG